MDKAVTIKKQAINMINKSINEDVNVFYAIMHEMGIGVRDLANLLGSQDVPFWEFISLYGAYKKVMKKANEKNDEVVNKGMNI